MPWHDRSPWSGRRPKAETAYGLISEIEAKLRSGDIGLRQALEAAYRAGETSSRTTRKTERAAT